MTAMNQILLECTVSQDAETTEKTLGTVTKFPVSYTNDYKNAKGEIAKEKAFFDIELYGEYGKILGASLKKNKEIRIVGRLKQERWEDADEKMHSRIFIIAEHIDFKKTEEEK